MNARRNGVLGLGVLGVLVGMLGWGNWARGADEGVEELTRGPVHEAFAGSVNFNPEPGVVVKSAPPAMVEEVPPDQRPEGDNVAWIPGYWGWDDDAGDFLWISGVWRNLPPGRQWVPGYWGEVEGGWQWTSGYWADAEEQEVAYLPPPPKSIESGPNVAAPSENHIWVSGTWVYRPDRYVWRPGYWELAQPDWVWVPAGYRWTRRGYVFVDGYWDYALARRGVLFAPVRFAPAVYARPNYFYTPLTVISLSVFVNHLFVRPVYGHYYFGDYYAPRYHGAGYYAPWVYCGGRHGYDPIFYHCRWEHRDDNAWERRRRDDFEYFRAHEDARPPHTWAALQALPEARRKGPRGDLEIAQPLNRYAERREGGMRFQTLNKESREQIVAQRQQVRDLSRERQQWEGRGDKTPGEDGTKPGIAKWQKTAKSPVVGKRPDQFAGADAPPKRRFTKDADVPPGKASGGDAVVGPDAGTTGRKGLSNKDDDGKPAFGKGGKGALPGTGGAADPNAGRVPGEGKGKLDLGGKGKDEGVIKPPKKVVPEGTDGGTATNPKRKTTIMPGTKTEPQVPVEPKVDKPKFKVQPEKVRQPEVPRPVFPEKKRVNPPETPKTIQPAPRTPVPVPRTVAPQTDDSGKKKGLFKRDKEGT